jgi:hypothetical protein
VRGSQGFVKGGDAVALSANKFNHALYGAGPQEVAIAPSRLLRFCRTP